MASIEQKLLLGLVSLRNVQGRVLGALCLELGPKTKTYIYYYLTASNFSTYILIGACTQSHCLCYSGKTSLLFSKAKPSFVTRSHPLSSLKDLLQRYSFSPSKHQFPFLHWIIPVSIRHVPWFLSQNRKPKTNRPFTPSSQAGQHFPISLHNKSSCTFMSHSLL